MSFDTWAVAAVAHELECSVLGGRVQQVVQVDETTLALEIYASGHRRYLLASADRQRPRLHLFSHKARRGVDVPTPLLQLMRKFVRGAGIASIQQLPWERVLHIEFRHPEYGSTVLVVELIGRWANLLLLRSSQGTDGKPDLRILDSIHRHRRQEGAIREIQPGQVYLPPPAQDGWAPDALTELRLRLLLEEARPGAPLWQVLVQGLQGMSPALAREISYRATGSAQTSSGALERFRPILETVAHFVTMVQTADWEPCGVVNDEGRWIAFAAYPLLHRTDGRLERVQSISVAVERFYEQRPGEGGDAYGVARQQVDALIQRAVRRLTRRQEAIQRQERSWEEIEQLRVSGEWILAYATQIASAQEELRLPEGSGVKGDIVRLDPAQTPADNAAAYFKRYRKAKRATESAGERRAVVAAELAYLDQLSADLMLASNRNEIDAVRAALQEAGYGPQLSGPAVRASPEQSQPRRYMSQEGYPILVGRNSAQNERVTFEMASPKDLWLHARGWPGAHVIIRCGGQRVSDETLGQAAALAAFHSRARNEAWVEVIVVERRRVRRAPGKRPGMVLVEEERVLRVRPREAFVGKDTA